MHGEERGTRLLADAHRIPGMVLVPVGERHMGDTVDHLMHRNPGPLEGGVAGKKGIDQDAACAGVDPEAGMAEPGNLHAT
jgi:hypothetical protein